MRKREVGLWGKDEDHQRRSQAEVTAHQPQTDLDGDERDREGRDQLQTQRGQERDAQRGHGGQSVTVGDLADRLDLGLCASEHLQRRQPGDDIQEVAGQLLQGAGLEFHALTRRRPDQRHEQRDQRQRSGDDQRRDPILRRDRGKHGDRNDHRQKQLREIQLEVAVERVDAARREDRELAGAPLARADRAQSAHSREQCRAQLGLGTRRGPIGNELTHPGEGGACDDDKQQDLQREAECGDPLAAGERGPDDVRQQPRLRDDQQRGDRAQNDQRHQERTRGAGVLKQPRVDGAGHQRRSPRPSSRPAPARRAPMTSTAISGMAETRPTTRSCPAAHGGASSD